MGRQPPTRTIGTATGGFQVYSCHRDEKAHVAERSILVLFWQVCNGMIGSAISYICALRRPHPLLAAHKLRCEEHLEHWAVLPTSLGFTTARVGVDWARDEGLPHRTSPTDVRELAFDYRTLCASVYFRSAPQHHLRHLCLRLRM